MNVVNGYKMEKYPNIESSKYHCHEPKASLCTLEKSTLQRECLGVKKRINHSCNNHKKSNCILVLDTPGNQVLIILLY